MNLSDALAKPKTLSFEDCKKQVLDSVLKSGKHVKDLHLDRQVVQTVNILVAIPRNVIEDLSKKPALEKYSADQERMEKTLNLAVIKAIEDPNSRQLLVLNVDDYMNVQQCFQLMQFCLVDGEYQCLVYQRSADISKLEDDWIFFSKMATIFEARTTIKVNKITVNYANIHVEIHS